MTILVILVMSIAVFDESFCNQKIDLGWKIFSMTNKIRKKMQAIK